LVTENSSKQGPPKVACVRADLQHPTERLVAGDEEVVVIRGAAVLGGVDLLVRVVHANPQHFFGVGRSARCMLSGLPG